MPQRQTIGVPTAKIAIDTLEDRLRKATIAVFMIVPGAWEDFIGDAPGYTPRRRGGPMSPQLAPGAAICWKRPGSPSRTGACGERKRRPR